MQHLPRCDFDTIPFSGSSISNGTENLGKATVATEFPIQPVSMAPKLKFHYIASSEFSELALPERIGQTSQWDRHHPLTQHVLCHPMGTDRDAIHSYPAVGKLSDQAGCTHR